MKINELIERLGKHRDRYGDIEVLGWDQEGEMRHLETTECDGFTEGGDWYAILTFGPEDPYPGEEQRRTEPAVQSPTTPKESR